MMRRLLALALLAFTLSALSLSPLSVNAIAVDSGGSTITALSLFAQQSARLEDSEKATQLTMDPSTGWSQEVSASVADFHAEWNNGEDVYGISIGEAALERALTGTQDITVDLDLNGEDESSDTVNARVDEIAGASGEVTRLVVTFAELNGDVTSGWVSGELQYQQPTNRPVSATPSAALFAPVNKQSYVQTALVTLTGTSESPTTVSTIEVTRESSVAPFAVSQDSCVGAVLTSSTSCTVDVTYKPGTAHDVAALIARSSDGSTVAAVQLDGARLPGAYRVNYGIPGDSSASFVPGPGKRVGIAVLGLNAGAKSVEVEASDWEGSPTVIDLGDTHALHVGTYRITTRSAAYLELTMNGFTYANPTGTVRIDKLDSSANDRHMSAEPAFIMTFDIHQKDLRAPLYGRVVYGAAKYPSTPGYSNPKQVSHLRVVRRHGRNRLAWRASIDPSVRAYVVRLHAGGDRSVAFTSGRRICKTSSTSCALGRIQGLHTVSVYAVNEAGRHSPAGSDHLR